MDDKQENSDGEQILLRVNATAFLQQARGDDYVLYHAPERRKLGGIIVDIFLEYVPGKGWWGALRLNGLFRIQLNLDRKTLFPTPEMALLATENFLSNTQYVRETLEEMHREDLTLKTFQHVPSRPADVDPEKYFSPSLLKVDGNFFTLYHLTNTEAAYRTWGHRQVAGVDVDLRLAHIYWKGWRAALLFPDFQAVLFEPAIDRLFTTPEKGLELLLTFCSEEDSVRNLVQRLRQTSSRDRIAMRNEVVPLATPKPPLRINDVDFVWQQQISEGDLYQAKRARFVRFERVYIQLVETWDKGWLGGLQFKDISGLYFEKEADIGFSTPEEAFSATHTFLSLQGKGLRTLRHAHDKRIALQCAIGVYDQIVSIRTLAKGRP